MSVKEYCEKYYHPYLCRTNRHRWMRIESTGKNLIRNKCKWCGKEIEFMDIVGLARIGTSEDICNIVDILAEKNQFLEDLPVLKA